MKVELVPTEWFNEDALRLPNYKVGRVSYGDAGRSYVKILPDSIIEEPFRLYTSLTTAISQCSPMSQGLLMWYCQHGYEGAKNNARVAAAYGTMMHVAIGEYIKYKHVNFDTLDEWVMDYRKENNIHFPECVEWAYKLKRDMASYIAFHHEYKVRPIAYEHVLLSESGFGTPIDLVCYMTIKVDGLDYDNPYKTGPRKGQPREVKVEKEILASINFKSGRNGFYDEHGLQALAELRLLKENYPDLNIEGAYNWSPKDWTGDYPTYNLKNWIGEFSDEEIDNIMSLATIRFADKAMKKRYLNIFGTSIEGRGLSENIEVEDIKEYCYRNFSALLLSK